jgi:6-phosphogluconolactonase
MNGRIVLICAFAFIAGCGGSDSTPPLPSKFLYASVYNQNGNGVDAPPQRVSGAVYAFGVDANGTLSPVSGSPFAPTAVSAPFTIAITHDSKFLYSSDYATGKLSAFLILSDGSLTVVPGSPFATPDFPTALVTHPMAEFLYVFGVGSAPLWKGSLTVYAIDSATGAISLTSSTTIGYTVAYNAAASTPDGRYLYGYSSPAAIAGFSTDAATGVLSPLPGNPLALDSGSFSAGPMAIDMAGKFLYVGNGRSLMGVGQGLYAYSIDAGTGALTPVPGSPFDVGGLQVSLAVDASGKFLIVDISPDTVACRLTVLSIDPNTGALTSVPGSPFGESCGYVAADPSGPYVYFGGWGSSNSHGSVFTYSMDQATGALTLIGAQDVPGTQVGPIALTH